MCLGDCMCIRTGPQSPEEGTRALGAGFTGVCEPSDVDLTMGPHDGTASALNCRAILQSHELCFKHCNLRIVRSISWHDHGPLWSATFSQRCLIHKTLALWWKQKREALSFWRSSQFYLSARTLAMKPGKKISLLKTCYGSKWWLGNDIVRRHISFHETVVYRGLGCTCFVCSCETVPCTQQVLSRQYMH